MDHFQLASANRQQEEPDNNTSLSAVNAVALAGDLLWKDAFNLLLTQGKRCGLMLTHMICLENMLTDAGYVRVYRFRRLNSYTALSDFLVRQYPAVTHALAMTVIGNARQKRICAVRRLPGPDAGFVAMDTREEERNIIALWLDYREIGMPKPVPDPPKMQTEIIVPSHKGFLYYQPNPMKNNIGDCVIRAYSAVFDQTWEDTLGMLAQSCEYKSTILNSRTIYRSLTSEYEFDPHSRLTEGGKGLTGREFCDRMTLMCRKGERFFANVGNDHVVGIIPAVIDGEKQYAVADSWDSSSRKIGMYWVYRPMKKKQISTKKEEPLLLPSLQVGSRLIHPAFGRGVILDLQEGRVCIHFPQHGKKTFASSWVQANCRPSSG